MTDLPPGWEWTTLGEVAEVVGGITKDSARQADESLPLVPYLRVANVQRGRLNLNEVKEIRVPTEKAERLRLLPGDVLLNEGGDRDKLGRGWVWEGQIPHCIHQNHVFRVRIRSQVIDPYLLAMYANISGDWFKTHGKQSVNLASISLRSIVQFPIPLPPQAEQQRIVEALKVVSSRLSAANALFVRVTASTEHFLEELLEQLTQEAQPAIGPLNELCVSVVDGDHQAPPKSPEGVPFLVIGDVRSGSLDFSRCRHVSRDYYDGLDIRRQPRRGDVLYTLVGSFGISAVVDTDVEFCVQRHIAILRPINGVVDPAFLAATLRTREAFKQAAEIATGTAQKTVPIRGLRNLRVMVPDLPVQRRIVEQLESFRAAITRLTKEVERAKRRAVHLQGAVVSAALSGDLGTTQQHDEPASVTLDRIRTKHAASPLPAARRRGART